MGLESSGILRGPESDRTSVLGEKRAEDAHRHGRGTGRGGRLQALGGLGETTPAAARRPEGAGDWSDEHAPPPPTHCGGSVVFR